MLSQSRRRNLAEVKAGRLVLVRGSVASLAELAPADVVAASHVLYFWHQPGDELLAIHRSPVWRAARARRQLRQNMPPMAQKHFPPQGHLLHESDDQVARLLRSAGFAAVNHQMKGRPAAPEGRVALATA